MNALCPNCNLKPLKKGKGSYAKQFQIDQHSSNKDFVENPYVPKKCKATDLTAFSLTHGSGGVCQKDKSLMMGYDSQGRLSKVPAKH